MRKPVFALDVDGVLLDIVPGAVAYVKKKYGVTIKHEHVTDWDWDYSWSLTEGLTNEFWEHVWNTPAQMHDGALEFITGLTLEGFEPVLVSTRPNNFKGMGDIARQAAFRDFPQLGVERIELVEHNKDKVDVLQRYNSLYMLEDNPINAAMCHKKSGVLSYLITRPWNERCICFNSEWTRVWSYNTVLRLVRDHQAIRQ